MYSFLAGQILFLLFIYLVRFIRPVSVCLKLGDQNETTFFSGCFFFCLESPTLMWRMFFHIIALGDWWWDGENWHAIDDFVLVLGKRLFWMSIFLTPVSAFSVSYSFSVPQRSISIHSSKSHCSVSWICRFTFPVKLSVSCPSCSHTKRSSHKLAASIVVVAVAAVEEDLRNTRCGSFYSADDFYRGVPSPSVRLLRASYSMTSW